MNIEVPFSVWDLPASAAAQVPVMFWAALSPGMKLTLILLVVVAIFLLSSPGRPAMYRRRRRHWKRRWDY